MRKIGILFLSLVFISQTSFAETCPNIDAIKKQVWNGFKAYDSDDDKPLSKKREALFIKEVKQFALAEWVQKKEGPSAVHCYYRNDAGSELETYLSKDNFVPKNINKEWYQVSGFMHCAVGSDQCVFEENVSQEQLAKK